MQLFGISSLVFFLVFQGPVQAQQTAMTCTTTADCAWGETCVAGDSELVAQACVPPTVCGGSSMGNCPSDSSGQLACLWRPHDDCSDGCAVLNGNKGIYKCVSLSRCDAYYGGTSCSDKCSMNGVRCNGQGSCNMMSLNPDETPNFSCACENGFSGEKCEVAPGPTVAPEPPVAPAANVSSNNDGGTERGVLKNGFGFDFNNNANADDTPRFDEPVDSSAKSSTATPKISSTDSLNDPAPDSVNSSKDLNLDESSSLDSSEVFILGAVVFVQYLFHRKQQKREEQYASALRSSQGFGAVGLRDLADGHTGLTPRALIVTM
ncbi:unnamed protein product [Peronospora belbahrii]|uniref:EGF-like domain-containing protein n=1 Tax=Peronospora belbahrii TaxID=622444 RepID=A0ABN8CUK0_9STRA|nr:unnamed protein product [Peronospora belbahrii]